MNKVPLNEVKAPCTDASFEVCSGESATSSRSMPRETFPLQQRCENQSTGQPDVRGSSELMCSEEIVDEASFNDLMPLPNQSLGDGLISPQNED